MKVTAAIGLLALLGAACASPVLEIERSFETPCDRLWVVDRGGDAVFEMDACEGRLLRVVDAVREPSAIVALDDGAHLVSSFADGRIVRVEPDGEATTIFHDTAVIEEPVSMAREGDAVWVLARDSKRLVLLDPLDGRVLRTVGGGALEGAHDLVVRDGVALVTTSWNDETPGRVQRWDLASRALVGSFGPDLRLPVGLKETPDGGCWVTDYFGDAVLRFGPDDLGEVVLAVEAPVDVAVAHDGTRYVIGAEGLLRFDPDGAPPLRLGVGLLEDPRAVTIIEASGPSSAL